MAHPAPDTLTPDNVAADLLAIADSAGPDKFAYYGYSWLAFSGLQLALRTDRLWALVMGGYPPMGGPYQAMLAVTRAAHAMSSQPAEGEASDRAEPRVTGTPCPSKPRRRKPASSSPFTRHSRASTIPLSSSRTTCPGSRLLVRTT